MLFGNSPADKTLQQVVPRSLILIVLYLAHYPVSAEHPVSTIMYETVRQKFYWSMMSTDIFHFVGECRGCVKMKGTQVRKRKKLQLFSAVEPMAFKAMYLVHS